MFRLKCFVLKYFPFFYYFPSNSDDLHSRIFIRHISVDVDGAALLGAQKG